MVIKYLEKRAPTHQTSRKNDAAKADCVSSLHVSFILAKRPKKDDSWQPISSYSLHLHDN